ncbi:MAG TPA: XRE family transcriptional regulator [Deltaproteobacteria bacterium]|nr:XRE family transcriptional regulator [Deltaproteobacteria bacterium]
MKLRLGVKVRALRRREGLTQVRLAERLGISASYLNLIEHDKRPLTAPLLIKLASLFELDVTTFGSEQDSALESDLLEVFGDPMFEGMGLTNVVVREVISSAPEVGRAVLELYRSYRNAEAQAARLALTVADGQDMADTHARLPSEEVTAFVQQHRNHLPALEEGAMALWRDARLQPDDLCTGLARHLESLGIRVRFCPAKAGAIRRYDPGRRELSLSDGLARSARRFQLAHQVALITLADTLDELSSSDGLKSEASRALCRMVLANYFAGAVMMPYTGFHTACEAERYDIDLLARRYGATFEQVCHRMTTLQRSGQEGVPFHFLKVDTAGNISKRFSASGIRFARFGGACPRWNVSMSLLSPGRLRIQVSKMPGGAHYFCVARTVRRSAGGFRAPEIVHAIGLGCELSYAGRLVYADGMDLSSVEVVPIGVTCRLCDRPRCEQRAFPSLGAELHLDENVRGFGFYTRSWE